MSDDKRSNDGGKQRHSEVVAVDLNQFRNTVVGQGYQAKHVVRQRQHGNATAMKVIDMSQPVETKSDKDEKKKKHDRKDKKRKRSKEKNNAAGRNEQHQKLQSYLQNSGLVQFCKELEAIVRSA